MSKHFLITLLIILSGSIYTHAIAQKNQKKDSSVAKLPKIKPVVIDTGKPKDMRPTKAAIMSSLLPGLGQIYNKKYWKAPLIWAAIGGLGYVAYTNDYNFSRYRSSYNQKLDTLTITIPEHADLDLNQLYTYKEGYRRNRDLFFILTTVFYAFNILDATVDAHLYTFDVSDNLSMRIEPKLSMPSYSDYPTAGVGVTLKFSSLRSVRKSYQFK